MLKKEKKRKRYYKVINKTPKELMFDFNLSKIQKNKINKFLKLLSYYNSKTNLVGKSTLIDPLNSHIIDCIQLSKFIENKKFKIVDIGTGAGLPGLILNICGFHNLHLVDSNKKKINFLKVVANEMRLRVNIINSRIENLKNLKFDYIVSRALANLDKLLYYSSLLSHKKTKLLFLKGKNLDSEIHLAKRNWIFNFEIFKSISDSRGQIIKVDGLKKI